MQSRHQQRRLDTQNAKRALIDTLVASDTREVLLLHYCTLPKEVLYFWFSALLLRKVKYSLDVTFARPEMVNPMIAKVRSRQFITLLAKIFKNFKLTFSIKPDLWQT